MFKKHREGMQTLLYDCRGTGGRRGRRWSRMTKTLTLGGKARLYSEMPVIEDHLIFYSLGE